MRWIYQESLARACTLPETGSAPLDEVARMARLINVE